MGMYEWMSVISFLAIGYLVKILIESYMGVVCFIKRNKMNVRSMYKEILASIKNKVGMGTGSILLFSIALIYLYKCNEILHFLGIQSWTQKNGGQHIGSCYVLVFFIATYIVASQYRKDLGAKLFMKLSGMFTLVYMAVSILFFIY